MSRFKKLPSRREIRRKVDQTLAKLLDHKPAPADEPKPAPKSGTLSHEKPESRRAVRYQPHRAKGTHFRDTRGDVNVVTESGAVRNITKPTSRVKREREARARKKTATEAATKKGAKQTQRPPASD